MRLSRTRMSAALALPAALALLVAPAAADARVARTCDKLTGNVVLKTTAIKIVQRKYNTVPRRVPPNTSLGGFVGKAFYGCSLPAGKVRRIGTTGPTYLYVRGRGGRPKRDGLYSTEFSEYSNPQGTWVLEEYGTGVLGGPGEGSYTGGLVRNLATNKRYLYWNNENGPVEGSQLTTVPPVRAVLSDQGILAGIFVDEVAGERTVRGFNATGRMSVFDRVAEANAAAIPSESLGLANTTVLWKHSGETRMAEVAP